MRCYGGFQSKWDKLAGCNLNSASWMPAYVIFEIVFPWTVIAGKFNQLNVCRKQIQKWSEHGQSKLISKCEWFSLENAFTLLPVSIHPTLRWKH